MRQRLPRRAAKRTAEPRTTAPKLEGLGLTLPAVGLLFAGQSLYGAMFPKTALTLAIGGGLILAACLLHSGLRADLTRLRGLEWPGAFFILTLLVALWSLTPYVPGGPSPVWAYVGEAHGAATVDKSATLLEIIKLMGLGCFFLVGAVTAAGDARARTAVQIIIGVGAVFSLWMFFAHVTGDVAGGGQRSISGGYRLEARFLAANTAGTFFAMLSVLALAPIASELRSNKRRDRFFRLALYGSAGLIFLVCLLMTGSRGGFLAACTGFVAFALLQVFAGDLRLTRATLAIGSGVILLGVVLALTGDLLITRLMEGGLQDAARTNITAVHLQAFEAAPWMGYGLGSFEPVNRSLMDALNFKDLWSIRAVHSVYLGWLEEAGILGALPMFACIGILAVSAVGRAARRTRMLNHVFALIAVSVVVLVHGLSDFALQTYAVAAFWSYLLGLAFRLSQGSRA